MSPELPVDSFPLPELGSSPASSQVALGGSLVLRDRGGRGLKGSPSRLESGKCPGHSGLSENKSRSQGPGGSSPRWLPSPLQKIAMINKQLLCYHPELPIRLGG